MLTERYLAAEEAEQEKHNAQAYRSWDLTPRQVCDIELLLNGAFSPLQGFLGRADYDKVVRAMRLADGTLWPLPITLDVSSNFAAAIDVGEIIALRDPEGVLIATLAVSDIWQPDLLAEAQEVYGTTDEHHPAVRYLLRTSHPTYIGGTLRGIEPPAHYDFRHVRHSPLQLRGQFAQRGWERVVAFQTRNPMHRAHHELTLRAAEAVDAKLLIHPAVGMTKPGDIDHYTRVRCYEHIIKRYPRHTAMLSLLGLAMRMGGPREAVLHAIVRKNYGCTHLIIGRDHAGPGRNCAGKDFYAPYAAQELVAQYGDELGIQMVPFKMMVYVQERAAYVPVDETRDEDTVLSMSGTELRQRLQDGDDIPPWFSYPEVVEELRKTHPPRSRQGFTIFFTGLSGAGKSTIANVLMVKFMERGGRHVTLLDGDIVRKHLSSELGFSKAHRDLNILRIGFVASEITKHGGIAICAPIAPYTATRQQVRSMIEPLGGFVEVFVSTPLDVCEARDRKGLYAKARAGIIPQFTGISDPYETPEHAEIVIDTGEVSPDQAADRILSLLEQRGFLRAC